MSRRERGASLLIPVVLIVTAGAFAVIVAAGQSGADIHGTNAQADATEALFLAETGIERATRRFLAGSACSAAGLSENLANLATIGIASGRTIAITAGAASDQDFNSAALPATQCRIQATGRVTASNVSRTVQAIIDRSDNLIGTPLVAGFDNPSGAGAPGSWTGGYYDYTGGRPAAGNPPNCTRAAYAVKARTGGGSASAESVGTAPVSFSVDTSVELLVTFDYRIMEINNGSAACTSNSGGGGCPGNRDPDSPENTGDGEVCFTLRAANGVTYNSTRAEVDSATNELDDDGVDVTTPSCTPTTQQLPTNSEFQPCSRRYNYSGGTGGGAFTGRATVRFDIDAGLLSFDQLGFRLYIPGGGNAYELWIDNVLVQPETGAIAGIAAWRDCSVSACPPV